MSGMRAPMTEAPADGCGEAGPKSGAQAASAIFAASPSNSPRRMSSRFLRAGFDGRGVAGHGEDGTVVRGVGGMVEQADAGYRADGGDDRVDHFGPASLADVGNTLDDWHGNLYNSAIFSWRICFAIKIRRLPS